MIELLVFDVDGCLSDGKIIYTSLGEELKSFNVKDGLAVTSWHRLGKKSAIITGRESEIVARRAKELGISYLFQKVHNKDEVLEYILKKESIEFKNVAAIGDDLNDYKMLKKVGWSFTPKNGSRFIKDIADTVLTKNGGEGAVREMIELICERENLTEEFLKLWR